MLCKTKQKYLSELTHELRRYFKKKDVQNIISDYTEFFDAGISEGKNEAEICEDFGDIKNLAREIADNQTDVKLKIKKERYIDYAVLFILGSAIVFLYWISHYSASMGRVNCIAVGNNIINLWQIPIIFALPLIFIFIKLYRKYQINLNERILFALTFIPVIWVFINAPLIIGSDNFSKEIGNLIGIIFFIISLLILTIALFIFLALRNDNLDFMNFTPVLFMLTGAYQTFNNMLYCFSIMTDSSYSLFISWSKSFLPLALSLIAAVMIYIFSFWQKYLPNFKNKSQKEREK